MPGSILVDDRLDCPFVSPTMQHRSPLQLSPLPHYIPVLTGSAAPDSREADNYLAQPSPLRRPNGICLNVNALPDLFAEDGNLHDSEFLMQLSPATAAQFGYNGASPTTLSALSALRQFLPSNFDKDGIDTSQYDMYSGDEFRMYEFKVRRCMRGRSHDWTECPFAHPGEKARRRDPRRYNYSGVVCPEYKKGSCKKGDSCDMAHGVFECWLHPTRYRTQPCKDGRVCRRRICFFAHTPDQLRLVSPASSSPSASPSPTFMYSTSVESPLEAFDLSGSISPSTPCKLAKSTVSEALSPISPSPRVDACTAPGLSPRSLTFDLSPSMSPLSSAHEGTIDFPLGSGFSKFRLPVSTSGEFGHTSPFSRSLTMPAHSHMLLERQNSLRSLSIASIPRGSNSAAASPSATSAAVHATQKIEDLVRLMRQVDLAQHQEQVWPGSLLSLEGLPQQHCAWSVPATRGHCDELSSNGGLFDDGDDGGEPRLERVESGKGLRAQIFESLLSSATASGY
ncbi:hypothetical protein L7F22_045283 [Adiantum nelumboides]|nr:hypothetical protein [Adiantum nelumboides]